MRNLSKWNKRKIAERIFAPRYLMTLEIDGEMIYLTNRASFTYEDNAYQTSAFKFNRTADKSCSVTMTDPDEYLFQILSNRRTNRGVAVAIDMLLGDETDVPDGSHDNVFRGIMGKLSLRLQEMSFNVTLPAERFLPNRIADVTTGFNHLPSSPLQVTLGGSTYTIES